MWIYLNDGFFSVVEHPGSRQHVVVRARVKGDLEKLGVKFVEGPTKTPDSDYLFRGTLSKEVLAKALSEKVKLIDYKNYKNAINDKERREYWYEEVWTTMANMQEHLAVMDDAAEAVKSAAKV